MRKIGRHEVDRDFLFLCARAFLSGLLICCPRSFFFSPPRWPLHVSCCGIWRSPTSPQNVTRGRNPYSRKWLTSDGGWARCFYSSHIASPESQYCCLYRSRNRTTYRVGYNLYFVFHRTSTFLLFICLFHVWLPFAKSWMKLTRYRSMDLRTRLPTKKAGRWSRTKMRGAGS